MFSCYKNAWTRLLRHQCFQNMFFFSDNWKAWISMCDTTHTLTRCPWYTNFTIVTGFRRIRCVAPYYQIAIRVSTKIMITDPDIRIVVRIKFMRVRRLLCPLLTCFPETSGVHFSTIVCTAKLSVTLNRIFNKKRTVIQYNSRRVTAWDFEFAAIFVFLLPTSKSTLTYYVHLQCFLNSKHLILILPHSRTLLPQGICKMTLDQKCVPEYWKGLMELGRSTSLLMHFITEFLAIPQISCGYISV